MDSCIQSCLLNFPIQNNDPKLYPNTTRCRRKSSPRLPMHTHLNPRSPAPPPHLAASPSRTTRKGISLPSSHCLSASAGTEIHPESSLPPPLARAGRRATSGDGPTTERRREAKVDQKVVPSSAVTSRSPAGTSHRFATPGGFSHDHRWLPLPSASDVLASESTQWSPRSDRGLRAGAGGVLSGGRGCVVDLGTQGPSETSTLACIRAVRMPGREPAAGCELVG